MLSKKIKAIIQVFRRGSEVEGLSRCPLRSASGIFDGGGYSAFEPRSPRGRWRGCLRVCWRKPLTVDGRRWKSHGLRSVVHRLLCGRGSAVNAQGLE